MILLYKDAGNSPEKHGFSIIVAARNEAENLKVLIPLLLKQNYPCFEIIVALDRCDDHGLSVVDLFQDERIQVIIVREVPEGFHGKKYAITKAINKAKHEWILLTDADCRPASEDWIESYNEKTRPGTEIILGLSPYTNSAGLLNALIRYETLLTAINYLSAAIKGKPYMGVGRNLAYKKSLFIKTGGFGSFRHITGGDDDLFVQSHAHKENTAIVLSRESLTYSSPKRTWKEYLKQKTRHLSVGKHYRSEIKKAHFLSMSVHLLLWLSFLYLILNYPDQWRIIGVYSLLLLVKGLFFTKISNKTGMRYSILWYPVVDLMFAVFLPIIGIRAFFVKNIRWN